MRAVSCRPLGRSVSALGYGCASLGSRVGSSAALRSVHHALDLGVTWFDVAPSYGDGAAEALLGQALIGRRDKVIVCTKFGIEPAAAPTWKTSLKPMLRPLVRAIPRLRSVVSAGRSTAVRPPVDARLIQSSVERSLRQLRTDRIDVLAFHDPDVFDLGRHDIIRCLADLVSSGKVGGLSVAGTPQAARAAAEPFSFVQFANDPVARQLSLVKLPAGRFVLTHSVFNPQSIDAIGSALRDQEWPRRKPGELLLNWAFAQNPDGVVLCSMTDPRNLEANCRLAATPVNLESAALVDSLASQGGI